MKRSKVTLDYSMIFTFIIIVACLFYNYYNLCYTAGIVNGESMYPTLNNGEKIYTSKMFKNINGLNRGDIVTATINVNGKNESVIKRIIGLPGEHVTLKNGVIRINGGKLKEPYIDKDLLTSGEMDYTLGEDEYLLLGDNRENSLDSRNPKVGPIQKSDIEAVLIKRTEH